jgi:hypothetical protein
MTNNFDPLAYYATYPQRVIARPGYPARAAYKAALLIDLFALDIYRVAGDIRTLADIGGCFGFGANSLAFHLASRQRIAPETFVFELADGFTSLGKSLFPAIRFEQHDFLTWKGGVDVFDLVSLIDVLEHVIEPDRFLQQLAARCRVLILKTPLETTGEWRGNRRYGDAGADHPDGHVNFFSPQSLESLLTSNGFTVLRSHVVKTIIPPGGDLALDPEHVPRTGGPWTLGWRQHFRTLKRAVVNMVPYRVLRRFVGGGDHLCVCVSKCVSSIGSHHQ